MKNVCNSIIEIKKMYLMFSCYVSEIQISEGHSRVLYIGLTCGMSAPYVAGQLDYCMQHPEKFTPVLIGFNPVERARCVNVMVCSKKFSSD